MNAMEQALFDLVDPSRVHVVVDGSCHNGIVTVENCVRCKRILTGRRVLGLPDSICGA